MPDSIEVSTTLPVPPKRIYQAWLDGDEHGWMTGSSASVKPEVGGRFTAWDGYITGTTLEVEPFRRIVQAWRSTEFAPGDPDSRLEVWLEDLGSSTKITLIHTNLPDGQGARTQQGWVDNYFSPMQRYFASLQQE